MSSPTVRLDGSSVNLLASPNNKGSWTGGDHRQGRAQIWGPQTESQVLGPIATSPSCYCGSSSDFACPSPSPHLSSRWTRAHSVWCSRSKGNGCVYTLVPDVRAQVCVLSLSFPVCRRTESLLSNTRTFIITNLPWHHILKDT
jgi:hypothetical protein